MKRKDPPEAASAGDNKRARPSTPVDDELEDEGRKAHRLQIPLLLSFIATKRLIHVVLLPPSDRDRVELPSDDSKLDADSTAAKRRHSRPLELDSEGEEEGDTSGKEESLSDREAEEPAGAEPIARVPSAKVRRLHPQLLVFRLSFSPFLQRCVRHSSQPSSDEEGEDEEDSSSESSSSDSSDDGTQRHRWLVFVFSS